MRLLALWILVAVVASCGFARPEPEPEVDRGMSGVWRGAVSWLEMEMTLKEEDGDLHGTAIITQDPIEGTWENEGLSLRLSTRSNASVYGTWSAEWGRGSVGGLLGYPVVGMLLRDDDDDVRARLDGSFSDDGYSLAGQLARSGDTSAVVLGHRGALPVVTVEVAGAVEGERVVLQLGTSFAFAGRSDGDRLDGVIEVYNIDSYRLGLARVSPR